MFEREIPPLDRSDFVALHDLSIANTAEPKGPIPEMMGLTYKLADAESTGTCFLISRPALDAGQPETILVTAAHVFEKMSGLEAVLVLREKRNDGTWVRKEVTLKIREKDSPLWVKHPEADVAAALRLRLPADASFAALPAINRRRVGFPKRKTPHRR